MTTHSSILLIDDSQGECELFRVALGRSGRDVRLHTEHDADAAMHFLADRAGHHQSSLQARSSPLQEGGLNWFPTARVERGSSETARSASTGDQPGLPSVILLDWHLQKQHGDEFLRRLRADHRLRSIPIVVFTTSDDASDLAASYRHGTNGYAVKPGTFEELVRFATDFCRTGSIGIAPRTRLKPDADPHFAQGRKSRLLDDATEQFVEASRSGTTV